MFSHTSLSIPELMGFWTLPTVWYSTKLGYITFWKLALFPFSGEGAYPVESLRKS
jgi:hypothetical protein